MPWSSRSSSVYAERELSDIERIHKMSGRLYILGDYLFCADCSS